MWRPIRKIDFKLESPPKHPDKSENSPHWCMTSPQKNSRRSSVSQCPPAPPSVLANRFFLCSPRRRSRNECVSTRLHETPVFGRWRTDKLISWRFGEFAWIYAICDTLWPVPCRCIALRNGLNLNSALKPPAYVY